MKILFFTFYFPPDLSAGSFRSKALVKALKSCNRKLDIHIITTIPNRYSSFEQECESVEYLDTATIHRIIVPKHNGSMLNQCKSFLIFAIKSLFMVFYIKPDFMIATTSRLMTGMLTFTASKLLRRPYFLDIRDIFSESISDTLASNCKILSQLCKKKIQVIEKIVIKNAAGVNLVSEGFNEYFLAYLNKEKKFSNYTNAIDEEFFNKKYNMNIDIKREKKLVVYAGNIGYGQGLEKIIPTSAKILEKKFDFIIIGDGNTRKQLEHYLNAQNVKNVILLAPMHRKQLIEYYQSADILFLHLNNYSAFNKVLPSKIFEYAACGKPIVAGLSGYAAKFLKNEIPYSVLFKPGNVQACVNALIHAHNMHVNSEQVDNFIAKFSRQTIMNKMASHILNIINGTVKKIPVLS